MTDSEETGIVLPSAAEVLRQEIYSELDAISDAEFSLGRGFVRLGSMLLRFEQNDCCQQLGYDRMADFMAELQARYQRKHTQLYGYKAVAEKLLPLMSESTLEEIGINKCLAIKSAIKQSGGKILPQAIIDTACKRETTTKQLRAELAREFHLQVEPEGTWLDLDGIFCTPEERKEFNDAVKMTVALLGIAVEVPDHIKRKDVIFSWLREFTGTHSADVYGAEQTESTQATLIVPGTVNA
jgi:hypothetical protein